MLKQGSRYSVIISDYTMPDGNGADLFKHMNEDKVFAVFILFTGHDDAPQIRAQFQGKTFLGIVEKCDVKKLSTLIATALTTWRP